MKDLDKTGGIALGHTTEAAVWSRYGPHAAAHTPAVRNQPQPCATARPRPHPPCTSALSARARRRARSPHPRAIEARRHRLSRLDRDQAPSPFPSARAQVPGRGRRLANGAPGGEQSPARAQRGARAARSSCKLRGAKHRRTTRSRGEAAGGVMARSSTAMDCSNTIRADRLLRPSWPVNERLMKG